MTVHVQFARMCDADSALVELHGLGHTATRHESELEFDCEAAEDAVLIGQVSHALDDWLEEHELPFTPDQTDEHTLVVRPPVG